ncbi:LysR family transcriptional regulator [Thalassospira sp.]|uniref:LysR family transcriptional regulator n=1 Tax=Thalassospira sp. TaxID=1912094 RepID=UPI00273628E6|nr:LysR family transcriptional regulator [Thalassospira sp.]MDP2696712.1 LysR family transcriptional regulator [Thalassospira sp.]
MEHSSQLDDLALFIRIVEQGSLRKATQTLAMPIATLSRRLQKLEQKLGCKLLMRGAARVALTDAGQAYFDQLRPALAEVSRTLDAIEARHSDLAGPLRLALPVNLARSWLAPFFSTFLRNHPKIAMDLTLSNRILPVMDRPFDVAIRVGKQSQKSLITRKISSTFLVPCASPAYLAAHGTPNHPDDLRDHALIVASPLRTWRLHDRTTGKEEIFTVESRFSVDEIELAAMMIEDGHGIGLIPNSTVGPALTAGRLVAVLPDWQTEQRDIFAVWPETDFMPKRQRVFIDALVAFAAQNPVDGGNQSQCAPVSTSSGSLI